MTEEELQALSQKVQGNQYKFSRDLLDGPPNAVSALEKELELKRTIVDAQKKLLEQTKNKQLRRERKKELREQQEKVTMVTATIEDPLYIFLESLDV